MYPDTIEHCPHCGTRNISSANAPHPARRLHTWHCNDCGCRITWFVTRGNDFTRRMSRVQDIVHRIDDVSVRISDVIEKSSGWLDQSSKARPAKS